MVCQFLLYNKVNQLYIYIYIICVGSSLLRAGFVQLQRAGATLRCGAQASHCGGFSCCGAWALGMQDSVAAARMLSSCGARAQLLRGMWDSPRPGIKPVSPALAGGFLTTAPPGKSQTLSLLICTVIKHALYCGGKYYINFLRL